MKLKHHMIIITLLTIASCQEVNTDTNITIDSFQGFWRDTIGVEGKYFAEEFIVDNYAMNYSVRDMATNILVDKQDGIISIGNDNKIGWYCTSSITNDTRETFWEIRNITLDRLSLYSTLLGEHSFKRAYRASIEEYTITDTLSELFTYQKILPTTKIDILNTFGQYNTINDEERISYLLKHPLIKNITFEENYNNDSIYSYSLSLTSWENIHSMISALFTPILDINENTDYCDDNSLLDATIVIRLNYSSKMMTIYNVKDYEYWPNISHYLGYELEDVKNEFSRFVYKIEYSETGSKTYNYQTSQESVCKSIGFQIDSDEKVVATKAIIRERYADTNILLRLLNEKYIFDKKKNGIYYFCPEIKEESMFQVKFEPEDLSISFIDM